MLQEEELLEQFHRDGYVVVRGFMNEKEMSCLKEEVNKFIVELIPSMVPKEEVFYEVKGRKETLKQIQFMFKHSKYFRDLMEGSKFEELAKVLLQNKVRPVNMQYFNKPPLVSKPTPPHQDGAYFMLEPNEAVTMWLALDHADEENGCIRYVPKSHKEGIRPHRKTDTLGFSQGLETYGEEDRSKEICITASPGDLFVHHANTIHRADANKSTTRSRRALGFIYYSTEAKESEEKTKYQEDLVKQLISQGAL